MGLDIDSIKGWIMDMDGVVTDTARLHTLAWKRIFDEFLERRGRKPGEDLQPFDPDRDYREHVDGKSRYDGVADFLASRRITLPHGKDDDPPGSETVCGLGNRKNSYFLDLLGKEEVSPFAATVDFIERGRRAGLRFALVSSSRNARRVLEAASLGELFDVVLDGWDAAELHLKGKPAPDIFLEAARKLQIEVNRAAVVEDALAGILAGKAGGFALVIGIDRLGRSEEMRKAGADLVVRDLAELSVPIGGMNRRREQLPSALREQDAIFDHLRQGSPALFLDYDGTLTPITREPADALLPDETREILKRLSKHLFVAVISGRALADIQKMVGIEGLVYAGSHGFEISGGHGYFDTSPKKNLYLDAMRKAAEELEAFAADMPGVHIERKPFAVAVHFRNASDTFVPQLSRKTDEIGSRNGLKKTTGKKIFELRPAVDWDKGKALRKMLSDFHTGFAGTIPLYIGDDTTDEDAFREIGETGISILVSEHPRPTAAGYSLRDPEEVAVFLENLSARCETLLSEDKWLLTYEGYDPEKEKLRETLCTLGNGYFASRGSAPESKNGREHYPGTYIAGCYNRLKSRVAGQVIENESLVNAPNWLPLSFRIENGPWFGSSGVSLVDYRRHLNIAAGMLIRSFRCTDGQQRETQITERRFVNMESPHLAALETEITPLNWSGTLFVLSGLDGNVSNTLVARYRKLNNDHLFVENRGEAENGTIIWLQAKTRQSHISITAACRIRFFLNGTPLTPELRICNRPSSIGQEGAFAVRAGETLRVEKTASLFNSRDRAISEDIEAARNEVAAAPGFNDQFRGHERAWRHLWQRCGLELEAADNTIAGILNLHIFHLLQTVSVHSIDLDVGIPPRGLHGEAYRGLIMWDELFVFPFLNLRIPDLTRALLKYRYRRLPQAKRAARDAGFKGAMFPWQSGSNGREEAQTLHLNPESGRWIPDNTHLQRHINIAVAYNVWLYYQVSGDLDFLSFYGAEMIVEIARFWASAAQYNDALGRYEIKGVMGPDEFHTRYPGATEPGLNNNTYTNVMVVWLFCRALEILDLLPPNRKQPLKETLGLEQQELELWNDISRKMRLVYNGNGILSQFEGYDELEEFDWQKYRDRYTNIQRLDRILEAEDDSPDRYKISKQADVLMLFYLLSADELRQLFERLGYLFTYDTIPDTIEYYLKRTAHGSTLSRVVHAWVLARSKREQSWNLFCDALKSDISDIQGGTTHEGIHLGAMAGTVDLIQRCYTGMETREEALWFNPTLPKEVLQLTFGIHYRHHWLRITIHQDKMTVESKEESGDPIKIGLRDSLHELSPGRTLEFALQRGLP